MFSTVCTKAAAKGAISNETLKGVLLYPWFQFSKDRH